MTTKFKPFDPTTVKNGDTVYSVITGDKFKFIGKTHTEQDASVVYGVKRGSYLCVFNKYLQVAVPKRTVWINMYSGSVECKTAYWYDEEDQARAGALPKSKYYIGTYSLEIDAE